MSESSSCRALQLDKVNTLQQHSTAIIGSCPACGPHPPKESSAISASHVTCFGKGTGGSACGTSGAALVAES
eukprot:4457990-Amphidinium_carterae.1